MPGLTNRNVLLGITGGIAAYKCPELVRRLKDLGANVRVVMTRGGEAFITPLTLQAVSGNPVHQDLLDPRAEAAMGHIELARWADVVIVAPATASFMARLAHGFADDLLSTLCLATTASLVLAPAMNTQMWLAEATQRNRNILEARGVKLLGPGEGDLACGETGPGRMLDVADLVSGLEQNSSVGLLAGTRVVVTAGPTREPIDPVRFVSNRSSGKMGYAVAAAAAREGAQVTLISGPVALETPANVNRVNVETAAQMHSAAMSAIGACDLFVATAAVADYRPQCSETKKIKKDDEELALQMERTEDILSAVAAADNAPFTVGFAAETDRVEHYAKSKLERKGLDMIAANKVGDGEGFEVDHNQLHVYWHGGDQLLPKTTKNRLAQELIRLVSERYNEKD